MDPVENEQTVEGERRPVRNQSFRALNEDFNEAAQPTNTSTALRAVQGTPGEGTSAVEGPVLHFLNRILR